MRGWQKPARGLIENIWVTVQTWYVVTGKVTCTLVPVVSAAGSIYLEYLLAFSDGAARDAVKKLTLFPDSTLKEHPSLQYCEEQVLKRYYALNGVLRGHAIIRLVNSISVTPHFSSQLCTCTGRFVCRLQSERSDETSWTVLSSSSAWNSLSTITKSLAR